MGRAKDCLETGLFLTGLLWADRVTQPSKYEVVANQAKKSLSNLKLKTVYIKRASAPQDIATSNINVRLVWVNDRIKWFQKEVKPRIEGTFGLNGVNCFQVGMDMANLAFTSGLLDESLFTPSYFKDIQFLKLYLDNLRRSHRAIGCPGSLEEFIKKYDGILSDPNKIGYLKNLTGEAINLGQELSMWVDKNIPIEEHIKWYKNPKVIRWIIGISIAIVGVIVSILALLLK